VGWVLSIYDRTATDITTAAGGLLHMQHAYQLPDEAAVARWVENPYHQHFTGETFFQHRLPVDPSSLSRRRKRIGREGVEWMLNQTIQAGWNAGAIDEGSAKRVAVNTTVMEKTIAYPTDGRLSERAWDQLVTLEQEAGVELRQPYARLGPRLALQVGRYIRPQDLAHRVPRQVQLQRDPLHRPALNVEGPPDPYDCIHPFHPPSARCLATNGLTEHQGGQS
jgi:hypothetical protein